jgi:16S rRNA (guanine527-N7)-methyltransferase
MDAITLHTVCAQNGLEINDRQIQTFEEFSRRLLEWNNKINVISRRDEENLWTRHILHCLSLLFKVEISGGARILDLGTGGGLPGLVLKIVRPDISFTLLDSTQKKINVVKGLLERLALDGIDAVWGRAEDLGKQREHIERYDIVVARAVAPLKDLVRWSFPLLKTGSTRVDTGKEGGPDQTKKRISGPTLAAYKGGDLDDEIRQIQNKPRIGRISIIDLTLKGSTQLDDRDKKIVVVEFVRSNK